ncbi:MAG: helix-turn-helix domain-containing protein, partial [Candidatus Uhrbacteria bacterium]|nr:helix-turn-helix domain-containing protein [Candidatus Uhrbacteria bacterium]
SQKEAAVYLALIELGASVISPLAKKAGINRTTAYDILASLEKEGIVARVAGKKKDTYKAENPDKLPLILEARLRTMNQQLQRAKLLVGELRLLASRQKSKPRITLYEGVEGIRSLYGKTLLSTEDIRSFSSAESLESFDPKFLHDYYQRRAEKNIFIKAIINENPSAHEYQKQDKKLHREIRIVPKELMNIEPEVYVFDNKLALFSLKEKFCVLIESSDIANAIKKLYDLAWMRAGEYHHVALKRNKTKNPV